MVHRVIGAFSSQPKTYSQVARDPQAMGQAVIIVLIVSFVSGFVSALTFATPDAQHFGVVEAAVFAIASAIVGLAAWGVGTFAATFIATALLGGKTNMGEMFRITGYASVFNILGVVPILSIAGWILSIIGSAIGIHQVAAFGVRRALATAVIAGSVRFIANYLLLGIVLVALIWGLALTAR